MCLDTIQSMVQTLAVFWLFVLSLTSAHCLKSQLAEEPLVLACQILLLQELLDLLASVSALGLVGNGLGCDSHGLEVDLHSITAEI
jgi:hypothetical protein